MKKTDLAYVAGIIDGEGTITVVKNGQTSSLRVSVCNTNEWLINWLRFSFGGSVYKFRKIEKNKQAWQWMLTCRKARDFIVLVMPYLQIKRPQAELAIQFQNRKNKSPRVRKSNGTWIGRTDNEKAVDMAEQLIMTNWNRRGDNIGTL